MKRLAAIFTGVLLAGLVTGSAMGEVIAYTSFEEPSTGSQYVDSGDSATDHALANNTGQMSVSYTSTGGELGFSTWYTNTRDDVGLTDGDYTGVTNYTGWVGSFTGNNGFEMSDADGMLTLTLDTVDLTGYTDTSVSLDLFVNETGWETSDIISIYLTMNDGSIISLMDTTGSDIDDLGIEDYWISLTADNLDGYTSATLCVSLDSNAAYEAIFVDNVVFEGTASVPVPGTLILLGSSLVALAGFRRKNA